MRAPYRDRTEAGRVLAGLLRTLEVSAPIVLGLARGGLPVAVPVARVLSAPLDVLIVRKVGHPQSPEFAIGAVGEGGVVELDPRASASVDAVYLERALQEAGAEIARRVTEYRGGRGLIDVSGRTVVIVDDGLATGESALAAVDVVRRLGAQRVLVAAPVASRQAVDLLTGRADEVVCPWIPAYFGSVGAFYDRFEQVDDSEVRGCLADLERCGGLHEVTIPLISGESLSGTLAVPADAVGAVVFAHGSGSSRLSPRNTLVARLLNERGIATLLFDLLTPAEGMSRAMVFDVERLSLRVETALQWIATRPEVAGLPLGLFGASTGAAAALVAAARRPMSVAAIVSRGGRPDLAGSSLPLVRCPTLFIVGSRDTEVLELNEAAAAQLMCPHRIVVIPEATHLFEEPGTLEEAARAAGDWFLRFLTR